MANDWQLDELDSLYAMYGDDTSVVIEDFSNQMLQISVSLEVASVKLSLPRGFEMDNLPAVQLYISLPVSYLAADAIEAASPICTINGVWLSREQNVQLCEHLNKLAVENVGEPVLLVWLEWLRMDAVPFLASISTTPCINCAWHMAEIETLGCGHNLCLECIAVTCWVYTTAQSKPCCPMRSCRALFDTSPGYKTVDPVKLEAGMTRLLESQLQADVVFCPLCENVGVETPLLCAMDLAEDPIQNLQVVCKCHECCWEFCGVCRSPCHPGEPCLAQGSRAQQMLNRKPALPENYVEAASAAVMTKCNWNAQDKTAWDELHSSDFDAFCCAFLTLHRATLLASLQQVLGATTIMRAPIAFDLREKFMRLVHSTKKQLKIRPGFHGTNTKNHSSIFNRGLLIPGDGNELNIANGNAFGRGVYVAQDHAAWLSYGFCSEPRMLICAVIDVGNVKYHGDAMVVSNSAHVLPLFEAIGEDFRYMSVPSALLKVSQKAQRHMAGNTGKKQSAISSVNRRGEKVVNLLFWD